MDKPELRGQLYNQPFRTLKKKSIETSETIPDLPTIRHSQPNEKANAIRNQVSATKEQIVEMEAKLKKLRQIKEKYDAQKQHNLTKVYFVNAVKERVKHDQDYKEKLRQIKNQSLQELKTQVGDLRDSLVRQKKIAEDNLLQAKIEAAEEQRRRQKHHEYLIRKLKELDQLENSRKVQKVKQLQEESASRIRQFQTSRTNFSKENYHKKVLSALKEREEATRTLSQMREEEQNLRNLVRESEKEMLTSLYTLETLNPQRRRRSGGSFRKTDRSEKSLKVDLDNYDNEEFDP